MMHPRSLWVDPLGEDVDRVSGLCVGVVGRCVRHKLLSSCGSHNEYFAILC